MTDRLPRLGFLGVGWIGRSRLQSLHREGAAEVAAIADTSAGVAAAAAEEVGCPAVAGSLEELLELPLDGVVIATPTALHHAQARRALEAGCAVFCQKPLGRTAEECRDLVELARDRGLRLGVDMSYRHLRATQRIRQELERGTIGRPRALELTFHNAYGPDRGWARDPKMAGGGALIDLGCHLLDLAMLLLGPLQVERLQADLLSGGHPLREGEVEDLALVQATLRDGRPLRLSCSWWHPAGRDAVFELTAHGEGRALRLVNAQGSFYDFRAELTDGARTEVLVEPPDEWGGRAICAWARRLADGFDAEVERLVDVAAVIDRAYGRPAPSSLTPSQAAATR